MFKRTLHEIIDDNLKFNSYMYCMKVSFPMNDGTGPVK